MSRGNTSRTIGWLANSCPSPFACGSAVSAPHEAIVSLSSSPMRKNASCMISRSFSDVSGSSSKKSPPSSETSAFRTASIARVTPRSFFICTARIFSISTSVFFARIERTVPESIVTCALLSSALANPTGIEYGTRSFSPQKFLIISADAASASLCFSRSS